jgi:hypothetical protein
MTAQERFGRREFVPRICTIDEHLRNRRIARRVRKQGHALALHKLAYDQQRIPLNSRLARFQEVR